MSGVNGVNNHYTDVYSNYGKTAGKQAEPVKEKENAGAVYEPSKEGKEAAAKMDRSAIVAQLQADAEARVQQMTDLVHKMMGQQGVAIGKSDDMWRFLASGEFTVDAATKAQAQKDIAEDGYWGVSQTSQRIFDFAMALTGGDADKMEEMRDAFEKGFKMATDTWGKELPDISQRTYDATQKLFDDYAAGLQEETQAQE